MTRFRTLLIFAVSVLFISACEEVFEEEQGENGRVYMEFKIDGQPFVAASVPAQCNELVFNYFTEAHLDLPPGYMIMAAHNCPKSSSLTLTFHGVTPEYTGTGSLETPEFADSFIPLFRSENNVLYGRLLDGTLTVKEFTGAKKRVSGRLSGTFEMRLTDYDKTDTLTITDGRFNFFIPQKIH
jgi:hypothetical protein